MTKIKKYEPYNFSLETTTFWDFRTRGNWCTHKYQYRGSASPYVIRNIILKYSEPNNLILDCFCGSGTTLIEAKLLTRNAIGVDINPKAIELSEKNINFELPTNMFNEPTEVKLFIGDAQNMSFIENNSIDMIFAHPPYWNIIKYSSNITNDLSLMKKNEFFEAIERIAQENYRILKDNKYCIILIGDKRQNKTIIPLGAQIIDIYLKTGFSLKELIIKKQNNCKQTKFWFKNSQKYNFLLINHEYLAVFQKQENNNRLENIGFKNIKTEIKDNIDINQYNTTIWEITEDYEKAINSIIVKKFCSNNNFLICDINNINCSKPLELLFVKTQYNTKTNDILNLIEKYKNNIDNNGYIIFETQDIKINQNIYSLFKDIVLNITDKDLSLKEIVIAVDKTQTQNKTTTDLNIVHKYLLIYQKNS